MGGNPYLTLSIEGAIIVMTSSRTDEKGMKTDVYCFTITPMQWSEKNEFKPPSLLKT